MNIEHEKIIKIPEIILKEMNREASAEEIEILHEWLFQSVENKALYQKLRQKENLVPIIKEYHKIDSKVAWEKLIRKIDGMKKRSYKQVAFHVLKYAAVFAIPLLIVSYFFNQRAIKNDSQQIFSELEKQLSGLKESSLILADGEVVNLQTTLQESIIETDGTKIDKEDSTLRYKYHELTEEKVIPYNCLVTPKSKVFSVVLADGTKVWLNASSAIKYPTRFSPDVRQVFLTGEAFFEVTRDPDRPFIVSTSKMEIEVLGTSFNVMAYPEEKFVEATLVSGEVKVKTSKSKLILKTGMRAQLNKETEILDQTETDTRLVTSWRFGKYIFEYENLENVMSKLAEWYDVEVLYADQGKRDLHFSGTLNRYDDIKETLHIIELATKVKFERSGDKIWVSYK